MAVPFRRTGKTAKRKRRSHHRLKTPTLVVCKETGEFTLPHRVTKNSGYYKGRLVLTKKEKTNQEAAAQQPTPKKVEKKRVKKEHTEVKKVEAKKADIKTSKKPSAATKKG